MSGSNEKEGRDRLGSDVLDLLVMAFLFLLRLEDDLVVADHSPSSPTPTRLPVYSAFGLRLTSRVATRSHPLPVPPFPFPGSPFSVLSLH